MLDQILFMKLFSNFSHVGKPQLILGIGIVGVLVFLSMLAFVIVSSSSTLKPVEVNKADVRLKTEVPHVENELVIRYQDGKSTADLLAEIERRENLAESPIGRARLGLENALLNASNERTPEEEYAEIQDIFAQTGVIKQTKIFTEDTLPLKNYYVLTFQSGTNLVTAQEVINKSSLFDFAQGNYIPELMVTPNDPDYSKQWGYGSVSAPDAWDHTTGSRDIIIGVVDSGIQQSHPDIPSGIIEGPDYIEGQSSFIDTIGHGTHVGGIIGAHSNNGIGVAGMNWDAQLMAVRVCKAIPTPPFNTCDPIGMVQGITYAVQNGARVINLSLGSGTPCSSSPIQQDTINAAITGGAVIVAAAGNNGVNAAQFSPASCTGLIAVGAIDPANARSIWPAGQSSNYGQRIDIAAPGSAILSTFVPGLIPPGGGPATQAYQQSNGTSQAAPFVSGAAALLLSVNPDLKPQQVKECILNSGDPISTDLPLGGRKLNVLRMLEECGNVTAATDTPTLTPSSPPTITPSDTPTSTPTQVPGTIATNTPTNSPTLTPTSTPTIALTPTPTGTVVQLYNCETRTDTRIVDGKPIQISWLDCTPIQ